MGCWTPNANYMDANLQIDTASNLFLKNLELGYYYNAGVPDVWGPDKFWQGGVRKSCYLGQSTGWITMPTADANYYWAIAQPGTWSWVLGNPVAVGWVFKVSAQSTWLGDKDFDL